LLVIDPHSQNRAVIKRVRQLPLYEKFKRDAINLKLAVLMQFLRGSSANDAAEILNLTETRNEDSDPCVAVPLGEAEQPAESLSKRIIIGAVRICEETLSAVF